MSETKLGDKIRHCIFVSDLHVGCKMALCHPSGAKLDDGGVYVPSKAQGYLWDCWREFWDKFVPAATNGEPYAVVVNGDCIDGCHHRATTQWSHNLGDQVEMAYKILKPIYEKCQGRMMIVRGTEVHVGQSAVDEETLAKRLGTIPNDEGQHARWELWLELQGNLIHFLHHIGTVSSPSHEATAINSEMVLELVEACRWGAKPPVCVARSHRHRYMEVRQAMAHGLATSVVSPAWQLKTPYVYRIAGGRLSPPQTGGVVISASKKTGLYCQAFVRVPGRAKVEIV